MYNETGFVPQAKIAAPTDLDLSVFKDLPKRKHPNRVRVARPDLADVDEIRHLRLRTRLANIVKECERVIAHMRSVEQAFDVQSVLRIVQSLLTVKWVIMGKAPGPRIEQWVREHLPDAEFHYDPDLITEPFDRDDLAKALRISQETKIACRCWYLVSLDHTAEARDARKLEKDRIGAKERRVRNGGKRREECTTRRDERVLAVVLGCDDRTIRNWKKKGVPASALRQWQGEGAYETNVALVRQFGLTVPEVSQIRRSGSIIDKGTAGDVFGKTPRSLDCTAWVAGQEGSRAGIVDADTSTVQMLAREIGHDLEAVAHLAGPSAPLTWPMWVRMEVLALAA